MALDSHDIVKMIKQISRDTDEAGRPCDIIYGTVETAPPEISVRISQKIVIPKENLVLSRNVTDFETKVELKDEYEWITQKRSGGGGDAAFESHDHDIKGTFKIWIKNALKKGEKVILVRKRAGQEYVILDRVGET